MSRMTRLQYNAMRPSSDRKQTLKEFMAMANREAKRRMIADGIIEDPSRKEPKFQFHWEATVTHVGSTGGIVKANTRGEARALIKKELGLSKNASLNKYILKIVRVPNAATPAIS